jgi:hypothetical protein
MLEGMPFTADDLSAAAQRLADTGFFDDVGASLNCDIRAITVGFDLKPIDRARMLHVGFENFVWLTKDEMESAIKGKFPLFGYYLPEVSPGRT